MLDFRIRGNDLVLERDIPLIKNKVLVSWPLQAQEMGLAKRHLVRIARLFDYGSPRRWATRTTTKRAASSSASSLSTASTCSCRWPGRRCGDPRRRAHHPRERRSAQPRRSDRSWHLVLSPGRLGAHQARGGGEPAERRSGVASCGSRELSISALNIASLERGSVRLAGMRPDGLDLTLRELDVTSVRVTPNG